MTEKLGMTGSWRYSFATGFPVKLGMTEKLGMTGSWRYSFATGFPVKLGMTEKLGKTRRFAGMTIYNKILRSAQNDRV
jgi:hypothetical protein